MSKGRKEVVPIWTAKAASEISHLIDDVYHQSLVKEMAKDLRAFGEYALWEFGSSSYPHQYIYHQLVPQLLDPLTAIAPLLKQLVQVELPITWEDANTNIKITENGYDGRGKVDSVSVVRARMPDPKDMISPSPHKIPPHNGVIDRFDLLFWDFCHHIRYGPYVPTSPRRKPSLQGVRTPAFGVGKYRSGAAYVWTVVSDPGGVRFGFVAYDECGVPIPYWDISPRPIDDLIDRFGTTDLIDTLSRL